MLPAPHAHCLPSSLLRSLFFSCAFRACRSRHLVSAKHAASAVRPPRPQHPFATTTAAAATTTTTMATTPCPSSLPLLAGVRQLLRIPASVAVPAGVTQENAQLRAVATAAGKVPADPVARARTAQWLSVAHLVRAATADTQAEARRALQLLDEELRLRVFVLGSNAANEPTLADAVLFLSVGPFLSSSNSDGSSNHNVARWYAHVAAVAGVPQPAFHNPVAPVPLAQCLAQAAPVPLPVAMRATFGNGGAPPALPAAKGGQALAKNKQQQQQQQQQSKKQKKQKAQAKAKAAAGGAAPAAAAGDAGDAALGEVDIRVGEIVKAWEHPNSEKLWCESVQCGEEEPRQILSGLRPNFPEATQMLRRVLVVCNLKAAKLGGIPSHGMVLCASNADHTQVEFLEPPEGAKVGERVTFAGVTNAPPAGPSRMNKKKLFAKAAEGLKTTADGIAAHNGRHMTTSAGPVKVKSLGDCPIK